MEQATPSTRRWLRILIPVFIGGALLNFWLSWNADPLGRYPVLDARENWHIATQILNGTLPMEPFYRALLYPLFLAALVPMGGLGPLCASAFGLLLHMVNAALCGFLARHLWPNPISAIWAAGLYVLHPTAQFFAVQSLDITPAITAFLGALFLAIQSIQPQKSIRWVLGACTAITIASLLRPHFLPLALLLPIAVVYFRVQSRKATSLSCIPVLTALAFLPLISLYGLQGSLNWMHSGEFRAIPWQGSYNLYRANSPDANGKYLSQIIDLADLPEGHNPTRAESVLLYTAQNPETTQPKVGEMNAYWKSKTFQSIFDNPGAWISLMSKKILYLCNTYEQYNNLTFNFHKERFLFLKFNPISWGWILVLAMTSFALNWRRLSSPEWKLILFSALVYSGSVLLFFVSARFRLPLSPLLCVCAAGCIPVNPGSVRLSMISPKALFPILVAAFTALSTFPGWMNAADNRTHLQDAVLLATASAKLGEDAQTIHYADAALQRAPGHQAALRLKASALFNRLVFDETASHVELWRLLQSTNDQIVRHDPNSKFFAGLLEWRKGDFPSAESIWRQALKEFQQPNQLSASALQILDGKDAGLHPKLDATLREWLLNPRPPN